MEKKKVLALMALAACATMLLTGCGGSGSDDTATVTTTAPQTTTTAAETTTTDAAETTYIPVTDADGVTVTDADGVPVTEAIPVTTAAEAAETTTESVAETTAAPATTATPTTIKRVEQTEPPKTAPKTDPAPVTTTPPTTAADTRPTILDTKGRPINLYPDDPWKYPYDVDECIRQCKAYIESIGMRWGEEAALDDGSWAGCIHSGSFTYEYSWNYYATLFDNVKEGIKFHQREGATRCKVIFVPKGIADGEPIDGEYEVYIVY